MSTAGAFVRLFLPSLLLFVGLIIFDQKHSETRRLGAVWCALSLLSLVIAIIKVARLLCIETTSSHEVPPGVSESQSVPSPVR